MSKLLLQKQDLPHLTHFPITFRKNRYYNELILQDTGTCVLTHKFHGENRMYH